MIVIIGVFGLFCLIYFGLYTFILFDECAAKAQMENARKSWKKATIVRNVNQENWLYERNQRKY